MTIASTTNRNDYTGNGATSTYSYSFKITDESHLRVTVRDTDGVETTLTLTTHYTVTGVGSNSGGTISLVAGSFAWLTSNKLTSGYKLTIRRVVPLVQETDIRNQGAFYPEVHEDALDYVVSAVQQLQDQIDRSVKASETDFSSSLTLPTTADRASKFLAFDADGDPMAAASVSSAPVTAFMETVLDDTTAAAARTTLGFSGAGGTVAAGNIEADAVTTPKILDSNVTTAKIAANAITSPKIDNATVSWSHEVMNLSLSASVAANALTIAVKDKSGSDASSTSPINVGFRSSTATTGTYSIGQITSSLSITVPSGTTIGTRNGVVEYLYVYLILDTTVKLAVSTSYIDEGSTLATTAISGASGYALYSTSGSSAVPVRLIGRIKITEATAGTWASSPTEVSLLPFRPFYNSKIISYTGNGAGSVGTNMRRFSTTTSVGRDITYDALSDESSNGASYTINSDGVYSITYNDIRTSSALAHAISLNSTELTTDSASIAIASVLGYSYTAANGHTLTASATVFLKAGDVVRPHYDGSNNLGANRDTMFIISRIA